MNFRENQFIELNTSDDFYHNQKYAGSCVKECLVQAEILSRIEGISLREIDIECIKIIQERNCTPTFLGYKGFPGAICTSVNNQLVHGIPSDYKLQSGDVFKVDLGATYQGVIADAARTFIVGKAKSLEHIELVNKCKQALDVAKTVIQSGKRIGVIGYAIDRYIKKNSRFGLVVNYGGHGVNTEAHAQPFIANRANQNEGVRMQPGMSLAIEPMITIGSNNTRVAPDGWTVLTDGIGAHFEDTIYINKNGIVEVLT